MKCPKCKFENGVGDHFCGSCGGPLARHVVEKRGVPYWATAVIALCCLTLGAVGFSIFKPDREQTIVVPEEKNEPIVIQTPTNLEPVQEEPQDEQPTVQEPQETVVTKPKESVTTNEPLDKISLIKNVSQKVFTILAGDNLGTGFLYQKGGYVVTNAHVVQGYVDVTVRNSQGDELAGKVIGISDSFDVAVIRVDALVDATPLSFENTESPVGLEVIAFGSPHGFENTASIGYITGSGRDMEADFVYSKLYQVDAQIDVGSSGGPLVDAKTGKVIGVNSLVYTDNHSFAFSIPLYTVVPQLNTWIQTPLTEDVILTTGQNNDYTDVFDGQEEEYFDFDIHQIDIVENYIALYNEYYAAAINEGDFFWIADMLLQESEIYGQVEQEIANFVAVGDRYEGSHFEVLDLTFEENTYYVTTNEMYTLVHADGTSEAYDIFKTYTVIVDEIGSVYITNIEQLEPIEDIPLDEAS